MNGFVVKQEGALLDEEKREKRKIKKAVRNWEADIDRDLYGRQKLHQTTSTQTRRWSPGQQHPGQAAGPGTGEPLRDWRDWARWEEGGAESRAQGVCVVEEACRSC